ncbi:molecular chaperone Hsp90 [Pseudonocardia sulfidoxydans NBRC 16205]|uniref:Molecular chaperone Hsp90 n=1 Tax=Pseudonocardia sulfidoxydans NBRC 16205 TaxID=1223511 RepID=A0A511DBJ7_9PSEU|nr:molecular chaperone Hsp90 [Pseudonocardia sulfidoxydans NBRC 16205]
MWFVELAQNAADAARAAGVPGRVLVRVVDGELRVANTGAPLDAAGVAALASLRASAKRDAEGSVGRFGVGFAAVLAVSREPRVVTRDGRGVRFSDSATAEAVAGLPGPAAELARRAGQLPVLRLAWPVTEEPPPAGYDTEVRLPLSVTPDLTGLGADDLLLALPDLVEITVGAATLTRTDEGGGRVRVGDRTWLLARATGTLDDDEAGTQAVEQRGRRDWSLTWALPLDGDGAAAPIPADEVLHAPTATTERLSLPARLIATVPLEPDRRRVRDTAAARRVLAAAAPTYLDLVRAVAPVDRVRLVPLPGFPQSPTDALLRDAVVDALRDGEWLPGADGGELVARRAEWLDLPAAGPLADLLAGVVDLAAPAALTGVPVGVLDQLGLRRLGPAALADRLLPVERPATWWHAVYDALAPATDTVPGLLDELRALPVPLADGRTIAGPRSVVIGVDDTADLLTGLDLPGLHLADPAAAHPLLERLGATAADPSSLLGLPALRDAVERSVDDAEAGLDVTPLARVVLRLLAAGAGQRAGALALPDEHGDPARADELLLPDAAIRPLLAPDAPVGVLHADVAAAFPRDALVAAGVLDGFALVVDDEPLGPDHDLHDEDLWWDGLDAPPARVVAVRDLDLVDDDAWAGALELLGADRDTRAAVLADGHTRWWLRRNVVLGGRAPGHWRLPSAGDLAELYSPAPAEGVDEALLRAVGVRSGLAVDDTDAAADLLDRLADPARTPDAATVLAAYEALTDAVAAGRADPALLAPPERVRALDGSAVPVDDVLVLDKPWLAAVLPADELVAGGDPAALAELLDLPLASDYVTATLAPDSGGRVVAWSGLPDVIVASHTVGVDVPAGELVVHDALAVVVTCPALGRTAVPAWPDTDGRWHATDPVRALIGALAGRPAPGSGDG